MVHNCGVMLLLPVKFVCSAVFESVEGDSSTQGVKMRFILMIDSKYFLLPGREGNFRGSTHCLAAFNLLICLASTKGLFPCSAYDTAHSVSQLGFRPLANNLQVCLWAGSLSWVYLMALLGYLTGF